MIRFLSAIPTILIAYIALIAYKLAYGLLYYSTNKYIYLYGSSLIFYSLISYWAYQRNKFAFWFMTFSLFLSGLGGVVIGLFMVSLSQIILKTVFTVLGVYFVFGGYILFCHRSSLVNNSEQRKVEGITN
jgi:hypothetical protein